MSRRKKVLTEESRKVYAKARSMYLRFCEENGHTADPAQPDVILKWMDWLLDYRPGRPLSPNTVSVYLTAVRRHQREMRDKDPTWPVLDSEKASSAFGYYRSRFEDRGFRTKRMQPLKVEQFAEVMCAIDRSGTRGMRDAAIVAMLYCVTSDADVLIQVGPDDVHYHPQGLSVDMPGGGSRVVNRYTQMPQACPVQAITQWVELLCENDCDTMWPIWSPGVSYCELYQEIDSMNATGLKYRGRDLCKRYSPSASGEIVSIKYGAADNIGRSTSDTRAVAQYTGWTDPRSARKHVPERQADVSVVFSH